MALKQRYEVEVIPRHSLEMERSALGSAILTRSALRYVASLPTEAFYRPAHRYIHEALCQLCREGVGVDLVSLKHRLEADGRLAKAGGEDYMMEVAEFVPSAANVRHYGSVVMDMYGLRTLAGKAMELAEKAQDPQTTDFRECLAEAYEIGRGIPGIGSDTLDASEIDVDAREAIPTGITTGMARLDRVLHGVGWYRNRLSVVAGKRGSGKTGVLCASAIDAALSGRKVAYASLERKPVEIQQRMVQSLCGWMRRPSLSGAEQANYERAVHLVKGSGIKHYNCFDGLRIREGSRTVEAVCQWAYDLADAHGLDGLYLENAQLFGVSGRRENRTRELDYIADRLMGLAQEIDTSLVLASQLTQGKEGDQARTKDCIKFEDNATVVLVISRDRGADTAKLSVTKHGSGEEPSFPARFVGLRVRYVCEGDVLPEMPEEEPYDPFADE